MAAYGIEDREPLTVAAVKMLHRRTAESRARTLTMWYGEAALEAALADYRRIQNEIEADQRKRSRQQRAN